MTTWEIQQEFQTLFLITVLFYLYSVSKNSKIMSSEIVRANMGLSDPSPFANLVFVLSVAADIR